MNTIINLHHFTIKFYLFVADFNATPRIFPLLVWTTRSSEITAWLICTNISITARNKIHRFREYT